MNRSVIAFLVAPLWGPVVAAVGIAVFLGAPASRVGSLLASGAVIASAIFTYGGTLAFGLPAFLVLRSRQLTNLWIVAVLGFACGALTWTTYRFWFYAHSLRGLGLAGVWLAFRSTIRYMTFTGLSGALLFAACLIGLIVGVTFWLIARPNRIEATRL